VGNRSSDDDVGGTGLEKSKALEEPSKA